MKKLVTLCCLLFVSAVNAGPGSAMVGYAAVKALFTYSPETAQIIAPALATTLVATVTDDQTTQLAAHTVSQTPGVSYLLIEGISLTAGLIGAFLPLP